MARSDRAYRKLVRKKTILSAEREYKDILLRDCENEVQRKTDDYRARLMRELYTAHPEWIPAEEAEKAVYENRMMQFDSDMAFTMKQASNRAAKVISKTPTSAPQEEQKLQQLQEEQTALRESYSRWLTEEIHRQLSDVSVTSPERDKALADIETAVKAFRAEQEKMAGAQMEKIRRAEDAKIQKLTVSLERAQTSPTGKLTLPEGVVLRVQDLCMYFGGVHAVDRQKSSGRQPNPYSALYTLQRKERQIPSPGFHL